MGEEGKIEEGRGENKEVGGVRVWGEVRWEGREEEGTEEGRLRREVMMVEGKRGNSRRETKRRSKDGGGVEEETTEGRLRGEAETGGGEAGTGEGNLRGKAKMAEGRRGATGEAERRGEEKETGGGRSEGMGDGEKDPVEVR